MCPNGRATASVVLFNLISCGSISMKEHQGNGLQPKAATLLSGDKSDCCGKRCDGGGGESDFSSRRPKSSSSSSPSPVIFLFWVSLSWKEEQRMEKEDEVGVMEEREEKEMMMMMLMNDGGEMGLVRVLVVDDSLVERKVVEKLLLRSGLEFEVTTVDSGKKALEVLGVIGKNDEWPAVEAERKFDIVLTDYCMPEMDGYELLKAIKEDSFFKSTPVVIMSSENDSQRISRCKARGAEDFIIKPVQTAYLQRLRSHARPQEVPQVPKAGTKRTLPLDVINEGSDAERRPRLAGVAVA